MAILRHLTAGITTTATATATDIITIHTIHIVHTEALDTALKLLVHLLETIQSAYVRRQWLRSARSNKEDQVVYYDNGGGKQK